MASFKGNAVPCDGSGIKRIFQNTGHGSSVEWIAPLCVVGKGIAKAGNSGRRKMAGVKLFHNKGYGFKFFFVDHKRSAFSHCIISKTWTCLVSLAKGFFFHSPFYLPGKAYGIVFVHPFNDPLDQSAERPV